MTYHDAVEHERWRSSWSFDKLFLWLMFPALAVAVAGIYLWGTGAEAARRVKAGLCLGCPHHRDLHNGSCHGREPVVHDRAWLYRREQDYYDQRYCKYPAGPPRDTEGLKDLSPCSCRFFLGIR